LGQSREAFMSRWSVTVWGVGLLLEELIAYCRDRLAHFKCPRTVDFVAELPRSETGKLYKRMLRDAYWAGHKSPIV
jgi:acyl-coenzyme A synthetase/AMP-(fatty) acid ligase